MFSLNLDSYPSNATVTNNKSIALLSNSITLPGNHVFLSKLNTSNLMPTAIESNYSNPKSFLPSNEILLLPSLVYLPSD